MDERSVTIKPQEGFQERFLSSPADIVIGGGSAGGGKTYALLLDPCRYLGVPGFSAVIFRRTTPQIRNEGGLWDTSSDIYSWLGGDPKETTLEWAFPCGSKPTTIRFAHLEHENDKNSWQGSQLAYIGFDELTHFSESQFFYMVGRNRSTTGIKPCIRGTCNPDPNSWVAKLLEWWINQETGFPIPERDGVLRYFIRDNGAYVWGDSIEEVASKVPHLLSHESLRDRDPADLIKSITFIRGDIYGNKALLEKDPSYLANLMAQDPSEKARFLEGNWKVTQDGLGLFDYLAVKNLESNFVEASEKKRITVDVAGEGKDLFVVMVWAGWAVRRILVLTKNKQDEGLQVIEEQREAFGIQKSNVLVDQGGIGQGILDFSKGYQGFNGAESAKVDPATRIKENYANLKTQCAYRMARRVNDGAVTFKDCEVYVDGVKTRQVKIGGQIHDVFELLSADLRSFKSKNPDSDGKKQMISKAEQKVILGGRSPDFGDTITMREFFEFEAQKQFLFVQI